MSEHMQNLDRILEACGHLDAMFWTSRPTLNLVIVEEARAHCARMRGIDVTVDEQADEIERLLPVFFSLQGHAAYPGGPEGLRNRVIAELLPRVRVRVKALKRMRDEG